MGLSLNLIWHDITKVCLDSFAFVDAEKYIHPNQQVGYRFAITIRSENGFIVIKPSDEYQ